MSHFINILLEKFALQFLGFFTDISERFQTLEDTSQRLLEFDDALQDVNSVLIKFEEKTKAHSDLGGAGKDPKHLDKLQVDKSIT